MFDCVEGKLWAVSIVSVWGRWDLLVMEDEVVAGWEGSFVELEVEIF